MPDSTVNDLRKSQRAARVRSNPKELYRRKKHSELGGIVSTNWGRLLLEAKRKLKAKRRRSVFARANTSSSRPVRRLELFIRRAQRLDNQGQTDAALDLVYDAIDAMLRKGDFARLGFTIEGLSVNDLSADLLLAVLTATLPARTRLKPIRTRFFTEVEASLRQREEYEEDLLTGLE